jgi:SagB-type dehydrogenase family enzyme
MKKVVWLIILAGGVISLIGCGSKAEVVNNSDNNGGSEETMSEEYIKLPEPDTKGGETLNSVIEERRSIRNYQDGELSLEEVSQLLWAGNGITDRKWGFRSAPSAGALYPVDIYVFNDAGIYRYEPDGHFLKILSEEDSREELYLASLRQSSVKQADTVFVLVGFVKRTSAKYGDRALRYVFIEAGHICQNILLEVVNLQLGAVPIGAFEDDKIRKILSLDEDAIPIYVIPVGKI